MGGEGGRAGEGDLGVVTCFRFFGTEKDLIPMLTALASIVGDEVQGVLGAF